MLRGSKAENLALGWETEEAKQGWGGGGREGWGGVGGEGEKRGLALSKCGSGQWSSP